MLAAVMPVMALIRLIMRGGAAVAGQQAKIDRPNLVLGEGLSVRVIRAFDRGRTSVIDSAANLDLTNTAIAVNA